MTFGTTEIVAYLAIIAVLIGCARLAGGVCRRYGVPSVIGELAAGIVLGPTVFAHIFPGVFDTLFVASGEARLALSSMLTISSIFLLFVVGLEIKVSAMKSEKKAISLLGFFGVAIPFIVGTAAGMLFLSHAQEGISPVGFVGVIAAAFAVSALPVIARIMLDLGILKTRIGTIIIGGAAVNDVAGWLLFVFALGLAGSESAEAVPIWASVLGAIVLSVLAVTILPKMLDTLIAQLGRFFKNNDAAQGVVVLPLLFGLALFTEQLGLHALFGAFVLGVALSESTEFKGHLRESIEVLNASFFAPLYFVAVGLKADFLLGFDLVLIVTILVLAFGSKLIASLIGGKLSGLTHNESMAVGFGLAARGGMGIILASIAYSSNVVDLPMFAALIVMAVATSFTAALIPRFLTVKPSAGT